MSKTPVIIDLWRNGEHEIKGISGNRFERDGRSYLKYEREDPEDGSAVKSLITIAHSEIRIHQTGGIDADMHFRPESRADLLYTTSYGRMFFLIETKSIASEITGGFIRIYIDYSILTEDGELVGTNEVRIEARDIA
ncbi:MAG: DUF1934 domain-containing protein [Lachnospiraceae bacterium]|nr:DUF1934 domain-containing protein [Lachnospiraceae bacterium]